MKPVNPYVEVDGTVLLLTGLDAGERRLVARLRKTCAHGSGLGRF